MVNHPKHTLKTGVCPQGCIWLGTSCRDPTEPHHRQWLILGKSSSNDDGIGEIIGLKSELGNMPIFLDPMIQCCSCDNKNIGFLLSLCQITKFEHVNHFICVFVLKSNKFPQLHRKSNHRMRTVQPISTTFDIWVWINIY